ncbi:MULTISPECIES: hypothetical protein [unclassified Paenibacillus]|uniref:hypothetical protein n=1 Tax=unclassified Paenibacillus TaxID=185978 RepID=UPI0030F6E349
MEKSRILVAASNKAGRNFVQLLLYRKVPVAALTNNKREEKLLKELGVDEILRVNTTRNKVSGVPAFPIGRVFIFETSLPLSCQYLQFIARWPCKAVTVVTTAWYPDVIYKTLGASYVVHTKNGEVGFLLSRLTD